MENCANVNGKDVCFCVKENESLHNLRDICMCAVGFVNVKDIKCCEVWTKFVLDYRPILPPHCKSGQSINILNSPVNKQAPDDNISALLRLIFACHFLPG